MIKQRPKWWRMLAGGLVVVSAAVLSNMAMAAEAAKPSYVSGGVGDDDPMVSTKANYNLHLLFAAKGSGEYLAGVDVSIEGEKGDKVLEEKSSGPLFYAELPAGRYRVTASFDGKSLSKTTVVNPKGARDLYFYW